MASAYRSYAHHHPGRYSAFARMPFGGDDPEYSAATKAAAGPVIAVLASYGLEGENAYYAALEFWSAPARIPVLLEMTGAMDGDRHRRGLHRHGDAPGDRHGEAVGADGGCGVLDRRDIDAF